MVNKEKVQVQTVHVLCTDLLEVEKGPYHYFKKNKTTLLSIVCMFPKPGQKMKSMQINVHSLLDGNIENVVKLQ